ncbi:MAG: multifunctional CCA addition/repair protein [Gammaproteobacteria bacterium]|nr:MAG: multifunctional CCA addition/repair protein [Gammaproteobacteria bacterium]
MKTYLVGGAVRDELLGREPAERDWVVVGATPREMEEKGFRQVGKDFPVFIDPETGEEHALARTERKIGPGYSGFEVHADPDVTLEEDLRRRDLTVNAMARDEKGALIDPFGGEADVEARVLRHVSDAFVEDPVRILRVARFAARFYRLGFRVVEETMSLMREMVENGEVDALVPERVWQELDRALGEPDPQVFLQVLRDCGALAALFPEIDRLFGIPQVARYHPEIDTGVHLMMVMQQAARLSEDREVRFAALLHDLGKGITPEKELPRHIAHEARGVPLVEAFCERYRVPKDYRELAVLVCRYHLHVHRAFEMRPDTILKTLEALDAFRRPDRYEQFLLACEADCRGRTGYEDREFPEIQFLRDCAQVAGEVDTAPLQAEGLEGEAFAGALREKRIAAIGELRATRSD